MVASPLTLTLVTDHWLLTLTPALSRCDFRDCEGMRYSLIDMLNLARTRLILGSGIPVLLRDQG